MRATLHTYRQSPRKVRLIVDAIRGKDVAQAIAHLRFLKKRAAKPLQKLLESAVANAVSSARGVAEKLFIKEIAVNKGRTMKRSMPRARGSASAIHKRTSHITISLEEKL